MRNSAREESLDRYTTIGAISQKVRLASRRLTVPMAIVLAIEVAYLDFSQKNWRVRARDDRRQYVHRPRDMEF